MNPCSGRMPRRQWAASARCLVPLLALLGACNSATPPTTAGAANAVCDLNQGACEGNSSWGPFSIAVSPRPIPVLTPVGVELRFRAPARAEATIDLTGVEMDMGPNRIRLQGTDAMVRQGQFVIPICLTGSMRWRLTVTLQENGRSESVIYEFIAPTGHAAKGPGQT